MLTVWQWTGRYNHAVRTGCETCIAVLIASADNPTDMAQAFAERAPPEDEQDDD